MYEPVWRRPKTVDDCLKALRDDPGRARPVAGGTDLVPRIANLVERPPVLVDLGRVDELRRLETMRPTAVVGATVTHETLCRSDALEQRATVLSQACRCVGSPQIRARGTIGGNLANASPAADGATALLALDARVRVRGGDDESRTVPLREFFTGPGACSLAGGELLEHIEFRMPPEGARSVYLKAGQRNALAIAIASVAVVYLPVPGEVRIALGSVAPTPIRADAAERLFAQKWSRSEDGSRILDDVAASAEAASCCIDDVRAKASYRRRLVRVLTRRALSQVCET